MTTSVLALYVEARDLLESLGFKVRGFCKLSNNKISLSVDTFLTDAQVKVIQSKITKHSHLNCIHVFIFGGAEHVEPYVQGDFIPTTQIRILRHVNCYCYDFNGSG